MDIDAGVSGSSTSSPGAGNTAETWTLAIVLIAIIALFAGIYDAIAAEAGSSGLACIAAGIPGCAGGAISSDRAFSQFSSTGTVVEVESFNAMLHIEIFSSGISAGRERCLVRYDEVRASVAGDSGDRTEDWILGIPGKINGTTIPSVWNIAGRETSRE